MSGSSATSTLDIVLKDDVSAAAKAIAASIEKVEAEAKQLDEALGKSGTRSNFQARLKSLGASREQIEGAAQAWKDYAQAEGLAMDKAGQWTAKQAAQAKNWENVALAKLRADRGVERAQAFSEAAAVKRAEETRARDAKKRVDDAAKAAEAEAAARTRAAEKAAAEDRRRQERDARDAKRLADMDARDERRRQETAARDAQRLAEQEARDRHRAAEQEARDEQQRVERRMRDDARIAEHAQREERRAAEAQHRHEEQLAHQREHAIERQGFRHFVLSSAAMAVSAHAIAHTGEQAWEKGAELQHERIGLRNAGRTPEQVKEIEEAARGTIAHTPTAGMVESMKVVAETTAAFGSVHHAIENLPFMMKAMSVLKTAGGDNIHGDAASVGQAFAKTFEERQTRPEDFEKEAKAMIPAMVATGGTFNPEQLYMFAQQAKSALPSLSMRFLSKIAPSLIGAQGGERAGTALNAFESVISGKANDKKQAQEWMSLGLLDPKGVIMKNGQATSWRSGAVKDTKLAMTDPLEWAEKYLIPALKKKGVDTEDREAVKMVLDTMFRNQNANVFASEITQAASRARLHKDEALFSQTGEFDEIYKRNLQDFGVASGALKEALGNLAGAATAPLMHAAANGLTALARTLNQAAELAFEHPKTAAGLGLGAGAAALAAAGRLSYGLYNGFGLGASATALTGSAHAIDAAAARLGAIGGGPGGFGKVPGAIIPAGGAPVLAIPAMAEMVAATIALIGAAAVVKLVKASAEAQEPGKGGQWADATLATRDLDKDRLADQKAEADQLRQEIERNKRMEKLPGSSDSVNFPLKDRLGQLEGQIAKLEHSLAEVDAVNSPEARAGRAFAAMKRPEQFGPEMPPILDREGQIGRGYLNIKPREEFGPKPEEAGPVLPPDVARRLEYQQRELERSRSFAVPSPPEEFGPPMPRDRPWVAPPATAPAAPAPADHALDGFVMGQLTPKVDTSEIEAAATKATKAGATMQTALAITAAPQVQTGSIDAATAKVQQLIGLLGQVGAAASSAAAAVASVGGAGARPAGPSLASRGRGQFAGSASSIG